MIGENWDPTVSLSNLKHLLVYAENIISRVHQLDFIVSQFKT